VTMRSGDFLMLPRGDAHSIVSVQSERSDQPPRVLQITDDGLLPMRTNGGGPWDVDLLCGRFTYAPDSPSLLLDTLPDIFHTSLTTTESDETLKALVTLLRHEVALALPGSLTVATALCLALFVLALRANDNKTLDAPGLPALLADQRLGRAIKAFVAEPARPWTIEQLAALAAMSRATFARRFRDRSAMTIGTFLRDFRMSVASRLMQTTRRSFAEIAADVGYHSEVSFAKAFKASRQATPAQFRRSLSVWKTRTSSANPAPSVEP